MKGSASQKCCWMYLGNSGGVISISAVDSVAAANRVTDVSLVIEQQSVYKR
jgi:hypothetical protein